MFGGLNSAVSGLLASQRALYTVSHNIDNSTREGYSRQRVTQKATSPQRVYGIGFQGTGTQITDVNRVRSSFVDFKYWNEMAPLGEWETKNQSLLEIERIMGEPTNTSFRQYMDDYYKSLEDLTKNPSDPSFREPVLENGMALTKHINETYQRFEKLKKDTETDINIKVDQVNSLADRIALLNRRIYVQEVEGHQANDLRDERELLVDELSKLGNVRVSEDSNGKYDVSIGGISLVNHMTVNKMTFNKEALDKIEKATTLDEVEKYSKELITWSNGGQVELKSGEIKGLKDMLVGNGEKGSYRGIPFYMNRLDHFAIGFATKINEVHKSGFDRNGDAGEDFFTFGTVGTNGKGAAGSMTVNENIMKDINKIAAATTSEGAAEDARNIQKILKLREDREFFNGNIVTNINGEAINIKTPKGNPDDFIKSIVSSMAVDSMQSNRVLGTQKLLQKDLYSKRQSISGVNPNEEMSDMVRFQHVYVAASKMVTTMDSLLDITVNRLGLVGR